MKIIYEGHNRKLVEAVFEANNVLINEAFYEKIAAVTSFDNATILPVAISGLIKDYATSVRIDAYWNVFGIANARTVSATLIKINRAKLRRRRGAVQNMKSIVNTLIHEYVHCVDLSTGIRPLQFTHFNNRNGGEENGTAPWKIGRIAEFFV